VIDLYVVGIISTGKPFDLFDVVFKLQWFVIIPIYIVRYALAT
jgi:hypothetical protein